MSGSWHRASTRRRRSRCSASGKGDPEHDAEGTSRRLTEALSDLGVVAHVVRAVVGPRVTRYELRLGSGVKVGKVRNLQQDIAYALAATEVRILAPIPGKSAVGVEVPNTRPAKVTLGDVFQSYPDANDWTLARGTGQGHLGAGRVLRPLGDAAFARRGDHGQRQERHAQRAC